jgi:hypothetical protein
MTEERKLKKSIQIQALEKKIAGLEDDLANTMSVMIGLEEEMIQLRQIVDESFKPYSVKPLHDPRIGVGATTNIIINNRAS